MWRKSSFSGNINSDCVEVALTNNGAAVRDSKNPAGPVLNVSPRAWRELIVSREDDLPAFSVPTGAPTLTPDMVRQALDAT